MPKKDLEIYMKTLEEGRNHSREGKRLLVSSRRVQEGVQKLTRGVFLIGEALNRKNFNAIREGVGQVGADEKFIYANPALDEIFGVEPGGMIGKSVFDFLSDPSDREKIQAETEMRKTGNSSMYEMFIVRKNDGALRKISVVATPFLDQNDNFYSTLGFVKDITEHHESIQEILKKEKIGRVKNSLYEAVHGTNRLEDFYLRVHDILREADLFNVDEFSIGFYNRESDEIHFEYIKDSVDSKLRTISQASISGTLSMDMILSKEPILLDRKDISRRELHVGSASESFMGTPLVFNEKAVGVMMVQNYRGDVRYTESNLRDFTEIGYTLSSVIQEKKNEIAQAQTALLLTEVNVIANAVGSTEHLKDLYAEIHESIKRLIPQDELSRNFYLVLLPKDTQPSDITPETLVSYVYYVDEKDTLPTDAESEALGKGVTSFLLRKGELLHCDQKMSRELFEIGELEINGTDSLDWIGVPLKIGEKVIGGLAIQSYEEGFVYNKSHEQILTFISQQIALAIQRKRQEEILIHQRDQLVAKTKELELSYESIRELADEQGIGHTLVNESEIIEYANEPFCELFGMPRLELIGRSILDFIISDADKNLILSGTERRRKGIKDSYDITILDGNGIEKQLRISGTPRMTHDGKLMIEAFFQDISRLKYLTELLRTDPITGLWKREHFMKRLEIAQADIKRHGVEGSLMFIDLLNFKGINDLGGGHARGDDILNKFGILLRETLRIEDEAGRLGGDEYGVRFSGSGAVHAVDFITRLKEKLVIFNQSLRESFNTDEINIGVSYGVMEFKKGSIPPAVILEFAEKLMYINKGVVKGEAALLRGDFGLAIDISDDPNAGKRQYMLAQSNFGELMELKKEYPEAIWSKEGEDDIQLLHSGISAAHMGLEIKKMYELGEYALASEKIKKLLEIRPNLNMILSSLFPKSFI